MTSGTSTFANRSRKDFRNPCSGRGVDAANRVRVSHFQAFAKLVQAVDSTGDQQKISVWQYALNPGRSTYYQTRSLEVRKDFCNTSRDITGSLHVLSRAKNEVALFGTKTSIGSMVASTKISSDFYCYMLPGRRVGVSGQAMKERLKKNHQKVANAREKLRLLELENLETKLASRRNSNITEQQSERVIALRNRATSIEKKFDELFLAHKIDYIFQKVIENPFSYYIIDFFFPRTKICLELDGGYHLGVCRFIIDQRRDKWLEQQGYSIIRLTNKKAFQLKDKSIIKLVTGKVRYVKPLYQTKKII